MVGDGGALVALTNPELFTIRALPVRVNLSGIGRGQTIVDQRPLRPGRGSLGHTIRGPGSMSSSTATSLRRRARSPPTIDRYAG